MVNMIYDFDLIKRKYFRLTSVNEETSAILIASYLEYLILDYFLEEELLEKYWVRILREIEFGEVSLLPIITFLKDIISLSKYHEIYECSRHFTYIYDKLLTHFDIIGLDYDF